MKKLIVILVFLWSPSIFAQNEWPLKPWVEFVGKDSGQHVGKCVRGINPTGNFPYRVGVSQRGRESDVGYTSFYSLQTQNDTATQKIFSGDKFLTGDLNGDGFTDVVMGTTSTSSTFAELDTAVIYWGTQTGIDTLNSLRIPGEGSYKELSPACIGDINNDGKADLILTSTTAALSRGKVYIYLGPVHSSVPDTILVGDTINANLGTNCVIADLNNDGLNDLVVRGMHAYSIAQPQNYDYVNLYWGTGHNQLYLTLNKQLRGYGQGNRALASFDVNGDGIKDLLWTNRDSLDWVYIHYGGANFDTIPNMRLQNPGVANFGNAITDAGDMNGDGYDDIAVGAYRANIDGGFVFVFSGGPKMDYNYDAAAGIGGSSDFGYSVAGIGDMNGDGLADIIVGAPQYKFNQYRGYWAILLGDGKIPVTDVKKENLASPKIFELNQNYPNPFNPNTTIQYAIPQGSYVTLKIYDVLGKELATLVNEERPAGYYDVQFSASRLSSGIYFYQIQAGTYRAVKKMILMK